MSFKDQPYLFAAKNILDRRKRQCDKSRDDTERDREEFFYWVLRQLEYVMGMSYPYEKEFRVNILEKDSYVLPSKLYFEEEEVGKTDGYLSYSERDEFISVLHEVVDLFNQIGALTDGGYSAQILENNGRIIVDVRVYPNVKTGA